MGNFLAKDSKLIVAGSASYTSFSFFLYRAIFDELSVSNLPLEFSSSFIFALFSYLNL